MKTLKRGSRGRRVVILQEALKANPYGHFACGAVDGAFGARTAAAVHEAKWWLGYRRGRCTTSAGHVLLAILQGRRHLTAPQAIRRRVRQRRADQQPLRLKALERARKDVGLVEGPDNDIVYTRWWGWRMPYCVVALTYWYAQVGSKTAAKLKGTLEGCNTDYLLRAAFAGKHGLRVVSSPRPGDVGVIDWDGHIDPDHALMVVDVHADLVRTLEANATLDSGKQGVGYHTRPRRNCWFIRVAD
jgi:hypothetical protein